MYDTLGRGVFFMAYFRKRGKKWYFTIEIGEGKNRKRKEMAGGRTKAEAEESVQSPKQKYLSGLSAETPQVAQR